MRKDLQRVIKLPEGVQAALEKNSLTIQKDDKKVAKVIRLRNIELKVEDTQITIESKNASRRESKMIGTTWAHINNMIKGVTQGFEYKMEICNVHFPMNVKVEGDTVIIKSFLGEKTNRVAKIMPGVNVDIKGSQIVISGTEVEKTGQTAANIEKASRLTGRDRRIFQDGIFITEKNGRSI